MLGRFVRHSEQLRGSAVKVYEPLQTILNCYKILRHTIKVMKLYGIRSTVRCSEPLNQML